MHYKFKDFEFNSTSLVLKQQGKVLAIRHNEAKVLALLLERADTVLSKEDILSDVWHDKVVSEQAVFQNISHLRNLFGNSAIKTYSKRGYQWQLETVIVSTDVNQVQNKSSSTSELNSSLPVPKLSDTTTSTTNKPNTWFATLLVTTLCCCLLLVALIIIPSQESENTPIKLAYIPLSHQQDIETITLDDNNHFDFTALPQLSTEHFQDSIELEYPLLADEHPLILSGYLRTHNNQTYIDFTLKGPFSHWQGQISGSDKQAALKNLQQHLQQPVIYNLLNKAQAPELKQANLSIAHQQAPDDLIILGQLIESYLHTGELEKAMVMADKLVTSAQTQNNNQQIGNALLHQSGILTSKDLFELSEHKLSLAIDQFEKSNDVKRQADAWFAKSWIDHNQNGYHEVKESLLKSAQLAFDANDKQRELAALSYLSVMAYKNHQENDQYLYLRQAEDKMNSYQLPIYHFARVPFHYAIFTQNSADKEPHLIDVLEYTKLTPDHWLAQQSRIQLMQFYLEQNRLKDAQSIIDNLSTDNASNSYLKTLLAQAMQQTADFIKYAQHTFGQAELAGNTHLSLDVALLLCSEPSNKVNYDFYSQYIEEKAPDYWRQANESELLALNL
ncbi:MAG: winged helix-turn-helix domain-containing protein [Colwellia sp.]|nr:winged helix-turn-helix domain-containing protein [Colwellia sp.]